MDSTTNIIWLATIAERIIKFRNPQGLHIAAWGRSSDFLGLTMLLRNEKKVWTFSSWCSQRELEKQLSNFIEQQKFNYEADTQSLVPLHTLYVHMDAHLNMDWSWFKKIPIGSLVISVWNINQDQDVDIIKRELRLEGPLWSQSEQKCAMSDRKYVLLAYTQYK